MMGCYFDTGHGYLVTSLICFQFMTVFPFHVLLCVNSLISAVKEPSSINLRISRSMLFAVFVSHKWTRLRELDVAYCQSFAVLSFLHGSSIHHSSSYASRLFIVIVIITSIIIIATAIIIIVIINIVFFSCRAPIYSLIMKQSNPWKPR
jgi:hypothetical protein